MKKEYLVYKLSEDTEIDTSSFRTMESSDRNSHFFPPLGNWQTAAPSSTHSPDLINNTLEKLKYSLQTKSFPLGTECPPT